MADEQPNQPSDYRARPLPEGQTIVQKVQTLQPEQRVVVEVKPWYKSATIVVNGLLLIGASIIQVVDLLFGANLIEPIVKIFTNDPAKVTQLVTVITQVYTLANLYLRAKTNAPITLRNDPKE